MRTEESRKQYSEMMSGNLPEALRRGVNIQEATILNVNGASKTADIKITKSGTVVKGVQLPLIYGSSIKGRTCLVVTPDPTKLNRIFVVAVF